MSTEVELILNDVGYSYGLLDTTDTVSHTGWRKHEEDGSLSEVDGALSAKLSSLHHQGVVFRTEL